MKLRFAGIAAALSLSLSACGGGGGTPAGPAPSTNPSASPVPSGKITHVVIIFQENRSPDNLFQGLTGADIATSGKNSRGQTVPLTPVPLDSVFDVDHSHSPSFLNEYNNGQMNGFDKVTFSCAPGGCGNVTPTAYGYVPPSQVQPYFAMAKRYTFADRMFQSNSGPSFPAHQYIISGTAETAPGSTLYAAENPRYANNNVGNCDGDPSSTVGLIDINTGQETQESKPCFDHPTLFDEMDAAGVSYKYYTAPAAGLWNAPDAISHIRFGSDWSHVIVGNTAILTDIANSQLPAVSWVIPNSAQSDHAKINDGSGPDWVATVVNAVGQSPYWQNTAIFVTWDDWGGWYDHVAPKQYDKFELGFRVPLIVVSPYAKPAYVSHVQHEFGSILHFTEETFGLPSLGYTDARADDLRDCFDFSQTPLTFSTIQTRHKASYFMKLPPSNVPIDDDF
ncbi:MAG TPA: alkaline phosphatase family protein [Candidatus Baltobacteraceae bacterium]|nr:alkaline phosphatase family protein [Candidatus Baltobacteraceae bacterium]